jgi:type IV pilus assembly protein PilB
VTNAELVQQLSSAAKLTPDQSSALLDALWETIGRELSVGEAVTIDDLGKFYTVKYAAESVEDPPGSGNMRITLPTIEPDFEPDKALVSLVEKEIEAHPEIFEREELPDMPDDEEPTRPVPTPPTEDPAPAAAPPPPPPASEPVPEVAPEPEKGSGSKEKPLGRASHVEFIDVANLKVDKEILALLPQNIAKQYSAVPIDLEEGVLTVGMIDPEDFDALQIIRKETGLGIKPALTTKDGVTAILDQYTGLQAELQEVLDHSDLGITKKDLEQASEEDVQDQLNENAPTAHIVYSLLKRAVKERASDVHIEPYEHKVVVRFRQDGILTQKVELPKEIQSAVVARLKILAALKIDEQRLPQDGRFSLSFDRRLVDFRFSTIPVVYGEKIVMRILDKSVGIIQLEDVGLIDRGFEVLTKNLRRSHGMILVTGPTGSGKTTSLYAVLGKMMGGDVNIITLEDPVEYRIESINQSQVHTDIGYTFASGLRAIVRQDPDIVMLGEIRDQETADMAVHAALTGHIVLSTLHTNDAAGAFPRLIDMEVEPFLLTSSIHTVIAQRLARKICDVCKEEIKIPAAELKEIEDEIKKMPADIQKEVKKTKMKFYHGKGCDTCGGKGYKGRIGIFEVLDVSEPIRELVLQRSSGSAITAQATKEGMVTMIQDGILKAIKGLTTIEEVWRVTRE